MNKRSLRFEQLESRALLSACSLPFTEQFESTPADCWEMSAAGRIEIVDGHLRMDDLPGKRGYSKNSAVLHLNLSDEHKVFLTGDQFNLSDEPHYSDGIFISTDGTAWNKLNLELSTGSFSFDISNYIAADVYIKLQQYDNYPAPYDGREWDNIQVYSVPPPTPQSLPYLQEFNVGLNQLQGWEFSSTNEGRIEVAAGHLRMDDYKKGSKYSQNEATLYLDLQAQEDVYLTGDHWSLKDEKHSGDGIQISSDGITWTDLNFNPSAHSFEFLLPADTTQVKFRQYDNYPAPYDGREWDNIQVVARDYSSPAPWDMSLGFYKDVFVDGGVGLTSRGLYAAEYLGLTADTLLTGSTSYQNRVLVSSTADLNGALLYPDGQPRYRTIFVNGGNATDHGRSLGSAGRDRFLEYYTAGGSYTGSCAGAFIIRDRRGYFKMWDGSMGHNANRSGYHSVKFEEDASHPFIQYLVSHNGTAVIPRVGHFYGPIFKEEYKHPEGTEFLGTIYNTPSSIRKSEGTSYIIAYQSSDSGRLVVQTSHPEGYKSGPNLGLMAAILQYSLDGTGTPDLKGVLNLGDTAAGNVGDKQYHLWQINIPAGTSKVDIDLGTDLLLYAQYGSAASSHSYKYKSSNGSLHIDYPAAGLLNVSVYGNHEIKNGVPYVLHIN